MEKRKGLVRPNPSKRHHFELSETEKQDLRMAFNMFDKKGSGTIEPDKVRVALRVLGFNPTLDELHALVDKFDEGPKGNQKESVNFNEFTEIILEKISEQQPQAQLIRSFNNLDANMDGFISLSDLQQVAKDLGEDLSTEELGEIIMTVRGCAAQYDIHTTDFGTFSQSDFVSTINKSLE